MKLADRRDRDSWEFEQAIVQPELERVGARISLSPAGARFFTLLLRIVLRILSFGLLGRG